MKKSEQSAAANLVGSVVKATRILDCFTPAQPRLSLAQISQQLGQPKSTTLNLLRTLERGGLLLRAQGEQTYQLGYKLMELSYCLRASLPIIQYAMPFLEEIQIKTGEIVYLTSHINGRVLYLEAMYPSIRIGNYSITGKTLPMYCTGCGKAMMAYLPQEEIDFVIDRWGLQGFTPNTITDRDVLNAELNSTRQRGYAIDIEEESPGVKCVAMPVRDSSGYPTGALSISGTLMSMKDELLEDYAKILSRICNSLTPYADQFPAAQMRAISLGR
ncbi:IclR family transcriptional regulator [Anaerotruncus rubiinfantis]|uniref:IclR family transcriptional regulator n=1 Tax=Anaerotruncus rubiinfantis TaxID=1720200 RepID=UPI0009AF0302|nr:IclR family transcriptional regulator [Anaerotruncus rubiinfantis]